MTKIDDETYTHKGWRIVQNKDSQFGGRWDAWESKGSAEAYISFRTPSEAKGWINEIVEMAKGVKAALVQMQDEPGEYILNVQTGEVSRK